MSVPLNWDTNGLPIGSQFAARRGAEATLLAFAYELEEARPRGRANGPLVRDVARKTAAVFRLNFKLNCG
jgi:Asp-tRNA(Asn)/Glu-tRNA(Gln) amidotransferase A subunit family amidase